MNWGPNFILKTASSSIDEGTVAPLKLHIKCAYATVNGNNDHNYTQKMILNLKDIKLSCDANGEVK